MRTFLVISTILAASLAGAQTETDWAAVDVKVVPVAGGLSMLVGRGGNLGLSVGDDGTFLVDDQFAPLTDKIVAAIAGITSDPVRFLVNTHMHGDHTGGNENFGKRGSIIVAHDNVRRRMSADQFRTILGNSKVDASPAGALPKITFSDEVTFYWNGDTIHVFHVENAHTDGDSIIHFMSADVFHMGDVFFNRLFPFIDVDAGGNVKGMIAAAERVLALSKSGTKIIPGHGDLAAPDDLRAFRDMLIAVRDRVQTMVNEGRSVEEVVAANPAGAFETSWEGNKDRFTEGVYYSLAGSP